METSAKPTNVQLWTGIIMIAGAYHFCQSHLPAISLVTYVILFFLTTIPHVSAQSSFGSVGETCGFRKAQGAIFKLLAVYASHVLTIKISPGQSTATTIRFYVTAALLPSSSLFTALLDLRYRRYNFARLPADPILRNMQKAINAVAVCIREKKNRYPYIPPLPSDINIRAQLLETEEAFFRVERGADASRFVPTMIKGNSQHMKVCVGALQLGLATLQLVSVVSSHEVAAYGYGSYVFTIIPYALGSIINLTAALFTPSYVDIMEMKPNSDSTVPVGDGEEEVEEWQKLPPAVLELAVYFAIVGGITHFSARNFVTCSKRVVLVVGNNWHCVRDPDAYR